MSSLYTDAIRVINGELSITQSTANKVILSNGLAYSAKQFHRTMHTVRAVIATSLMNDTIKNRQQALSMALLEKEQLVDVSIEHLKDAIKEKQNTIAPEPERIGTTKLWVSLRYIILINHNSIESDSIEYMWYFANRHTSHSELEKNYQELYGRRWEAHAGGFYMFNKNIPELTIFGKSDTFGCDQETFDSALPVLRDSDYIKRNNINIIIIPNQ